MAYNTHSDSAVPIVHDVLGTLFPPQGCIDKLQAALPRTSSEHLQSVLDDWFHSAQRDFTYLSMIGSYTPIGQILKASLPRVLLEKGLLSKDTLDTFDASSITSALTSLPPRPSLRPLHDLLTNDAIEFRLMAASNGAAASTRALLDHALGEQDSLKWEVFSCDEIKVAKPADEVYEAVWQKLDMQSKRKRRAWFVASHTWDLCAAKKAGFMTAWTSYEEHLPLSEIWGQPDIIASDLEDAAKQIIEHEQNRAKNEFM